jgi:hypothetical protein
MHHVGFTILYDKVIYISYDLSCLKNSYFWGFIENIIIG